MKTPEKAIILAAGFSTRMLPLSLDTPKPIMPLWGKPVIKHLLALLSRWGVKEVLINLHFNPSPICEYLKKEPPANLRISFSFEPEIMGTGGALRRAGWFPDADPFWMVNSDIAADLTPGRFLAEFKRRNTIAALWMESNRGPRTVEMRRGNIVDFQTSRPGTNGTYTFCGLQLISPALLDYLPPDRFCSIIQAYQNAIQAGRLVRGVCVPGSYWADLGTPKSYLKAHVEILDCYRRHLPGHNLFNPAQGRLTAQLRKKGVFITGFAAIDKPVVIEPGARIENSVIWRGARIGKKAVIENAVIGSDCEINGRVTRLAVKYPAATHFAGAGLATQVKTRSGPGQALRNPAKPGSRMVSWRRRVKSDPTTKTADSYFDPQLSVTLRQLNLKPAEAIIIPFNPRGSARSFTRITGKGKSWIMIRYSLERTENCLYAQHARFLARLGLDVPKVAADFPQQQLVLIQDLGDTSLQQIAARSSMAELVKYYRRALDSVVILHERGASRALKERLATVPPFSPDLYRWEREYFARHFLAPYLRLNQAQVSGIMSKLAEIGKALSREKPVLIHRDLQSSNIIFYQAKPYFIDFQGMRFGPAAYDLASFLCDPYVSLPIDVQLSLLDYYNRHIAAKHQVTASSFWLAAVQRLAQALGAYGFLSANKETAGFGRYISPALRMLRRALEQADVCKSSVFKVLERL